MFGFIGRLICNFQNKISLLEPIGIDKVLMDELSAPLIEKGHEFIFYDNKTTDTEELYNRAKDSDIVMIANNPLPDSVIERCEKIKMLERFVQNLHDKGKEKTCGNPFFEVYC